MEKHHIPPRSKPPSQSSRVFIALFICSLVILNGCSPNDRIAEADKDEETAIARVGDTVLYGNELKDHIDGKHDETSRGPDSAAVKRQLDAMVTEEVLFQEAVRREIPNDPEVKARVRQLVIQILLEKEISEKSWSREIGEPELQAYYDSKQRDFNSPEQIRLADIFIAVPLGADLAEKAALRQRAELALSQAIAGQKSRTGFADLIDTYSDSPKHYSRGDTGFFDHEGSPHDIDPIMAQAGFSLGHRGSIYPEVIEASDGYHVIMKTGQKAPSHTSFDQVRAQLEQQLRREEIQTKRLEFIAQLHEKAKIDIDEKVFAEVCRELDSGYARVADGNPYTGPRSHGQ